MPFSLAELRHRAADFARQHADDHDEKSQAQEFLRDFFDVFTPQGRRRARFEVRVKKPDGAQGYIDALWPGTLLVEQKSRGRDLDAAHQQALDYLPNLPPAALPGYVLVSDFARLRLYDLDQGCQHEFALAELPEHLHLFGFLTGYRPAGQQRPEDPANAEAAELMAQLHDALLADGYAGHPLEVLLVRLLFCLFAEDTAIFEKDEFRALLEEHTAPDGHDLGAKLGELFAVLDTLRLSYVCSRHTTYLCNPYQLLKPASLASFPIYPTCGMANLFGLNVSYCNFDNLKASVQTRQVGLWTTVFWRILAMRSDCIIVSPTMPLQKTSSSTRPCGFGSSAGGRRRWRGGAIPVTISRLRENAFRSKPKPTATYGWV